MSEEPDPYVTDPLWTKPVITDEQLRKFIWQEIGAQILHTDTLASPVEMSIMRDASIRGVRLMFRSYVAAGGPSIGHMEVADTWWDQWKEEHPRLSRYLRPPTFRYVEHKFFARICPHLPRAPGSGGEHEFWVSDRVPDASTPTDD